MPTLVNDDAAAQDACARDRRAAAPSTAQVIEIRVDRHAGDPSRLPMSRSDQVLPIVIADATAAHGGSLQSALRPRGQLAAGRRLVGSRRSSCSPAHAARRRVDAGIARSAVSRPARSATPCVQAHAAATCRSGIGRRNPRSERRHRPTGTPPRRARRRRRRRPGGRHSGAPRRRRPTKSPVDQGGRHGHGRREDGGRAAADAEAAELRHCSASSARPLLGGLLGLT